MNISNNPSIRFDNVGSPASQTPVQQSIAKQLEGLSSPRTSASELKECAPSRNEAISSFLGSSLSSLAKTLGSEKLQMAADSYGPDNKKASAVINSNIAAQLKQLG
jgi:hypothetical protein